MSQAERPEIAASLYQLKNDPYSSHSVLRALLAEGHGWRLLEVYSAQGDLAQLLTERGFEITCLEGDPQLAAGASARRLNVVVADLDNCLPALGGPFDVIVCGDIAAARDHLRPRDWARLVGRQHGWLHCQ